MFSSGRHKVLVALLCMAAALFSAGAAQAQVYKFRSHGGFAKIEPLGDHGVAINVWHLGPSSAQTAQISYYAYQYGPLYDTFDFGNGAIPAADIQGDSIAVFRVHTTTARPDFFNQHCVFDHFDGSGYCETSSGGNVDVEWRATKVFRQEEVGHSMMTTGPVRTLVNGSQSIRSAWAKGNILGIPIDTEGTIGTDHGSSIEIQKLK